MNEYEKHKCSNILSKLGAKSLKLINQTTIHKLMARTFVTLFVMTGYIRLGIFERSYSPTRMESFNDIKVLLWRSFSFALLHSLLPEKTFGSQEIERSFGISTKANILLKKVHLLRVVSNIGSSKNKIQTFR